MQLAHFRKTLGAAALMAVPAAALLVGCGGDGTNGGSGSRPTRIVYVSDNNPAGNNIDVYKNDGTGHLGLIQTQASGGRGSVGLEDAARNYFPHDKDNEMITNSARTLLFAANQGSQPGSNQG
nr:hypothetical protein [Armatimonadota bacterium]